MLFWCVVLLAVCFAGIYISNESAKRKIRRFSKRLTDFEKSYYGDLYQPDDSEDKEWESKEFYLLEKFPIRLEKLRFCYQCPLYRNKVLKDRQRLFQKDKEL